MEVQKQAAAPPELFRQEGGELTLTAEGREFSAAMLAAQDAARERLDKSAPAMQEFKRIHGVYRDILETPLCNFNRDFLLGLEKLGRFWQKTLEKQGPDITHEFFASLFFLAFTEPDTLTKIFEDAWKEQEAQKPKEIVPKIITCLNDTITNGLQYGAATARAIEGGKEIKLERIRGKQPILNTGAHNVILSGMNKAIITGYFKFYFAEGSSYKGGCTQTYTTPFQRQVYSVICSFWREGQYNDNLLCTEVPTQRPVHISLRKIWEVLNGESARTPDKRTRPKAKDLKEIDEAISFWAAIRLEADLSRDYKSKDYDALKKLHVEDFPLLIVTPSEAEFADGTIEKRTYILHSEPYLYTFASTRHQIIGIDTSWLPLDEYKDGKFIRGRMTPEHRTMQWELIKIIRVVESAWESFATKHYYKERRVRKKGEALQPPSIDDFMEQCHKVVYTKWETFFDACSIKNAGSSRETDRRRRNFVLGRLKNYKMRGLINDFDQEWDTAVTRGGHSRSLGFYVTPNH